MTIPFFFSFSTKNGPKNAIFDAGKNVRYVAGLRYSYTLWVNGKSFKNFVQAQSKMLDSWMTKIDEQEYRIVLGKIFKLINQSNKKKLLNIYWIIRFSFFFFH